MKRHISLFISLCIMISCFTNCIKANEIVIIENNQNRIVEEYKQNYIDSSSYYVYIPDDVIEFLQMDMNLVIDEFAGIKICKRLLNEYFELDIERLTYNDLIESDPDFDVSQITSLNENTVGPTASILPDVDGGWDGTFTAPTGYNSIVVSSKYCIVIIFPNIKLLSSQNNFLCSFVKPLPTFNLFPL